MDILGGTNFRKWQGRRLVWLKRSKGGIVDVEVREERILKFLQGLEHKIDMP